MCRVIRLQLSGYQTIHFESDPHERFGVFLHKTAWARFEVFLNKNIIILLTKAESFRLHVFIRSNYKRLYIEFQMIHIMSDDTYHVR